MGLFGPNCNHVGGDANKALSAPDKMSIAAWSGAVSP